MEKWKDIEGYEGLYQVSSEGRLLNVKRNKIISPWLDNSGYMRYSLYNKKREVVQVHRLIAIHFIPNPDNLPEVNHKNENPTDNRIENLEWCDRKYNINYGTRNNKVSKALSIPILQFTKEGEFIRKWESATQVEKELGLGGNHISSCCKGKLKTAYGFVWMYAVINGFEIDINKLKRKRVA